MSETKRQLMLGAILTGLVIDQASVVTDVMRCHVKNESQLRIDGDNLQFHFNGTNHEWVNVLEHWIEHRARIENIDYIPLPSPEPEEPEVLPEDTPQKTIFARCPWCKEGLILGGWIDPDGSEGWTCDRCGDCEDHHLQPAKPAKPAKLPRKTISKAERQYHKAYGVIRTVSNYGYMPKVTRAEESLNKRGWDVVGWDDKYRMTLFISIRDSRYPDLHRRLLCANDAGYIPF